MPLDHSQEQKAKQWLQSNFKGCANCQGKNIGIGEIVAPPTFAGGNIQIGGPTIPMLAVTCNSCAYTMLFAAVPMGLLSP